MLTALVGIYVIGWLVSSYLIYCATTSFSVWKSIALATLWPGGVLGTLAFFCKFMLEDFLYNLPENKL